MLFPPTCSSILHLSTILPPYGYQIYLFFLLPLPPPPPPPHPAALGGGGGFQIFLVCYSLCSFICLQAVYQLSGPHVQISFLVLFNWKGFELMFFLFPILLSSYLEFC